MQPPPATDSAMAPSEPPAAPPAPFVPIAEAQRIQALDLVRGFALLGIFLMNVESFNRWFTDILSRGIPPEAQGLDWAATFFVNYFIQGKFWTIFATLFGMGFAVMLVRAEQAGRPFVRVYLRRILALAVFGACHFIFLWEGDILFSYAVAALILLMVLYARPWMFLVAIAAGAGLGFLAEPFFAVAGGLAASGLIALHLRGTWRVRLAGRSVPLVSFIQMVIGVVLTVAALVLWVLPDAPIEPRVPLTVLGPLLVVLGALLWHWREPAGLRSLRLGVSIYVFGGLVATGIALGQHLTPDPLVVLTEAAQKEAANAAAPARAASAASAASGDIPASGTKAGDKPRKTKAQKAEEMKAERERRKAEREQERSEGVKLAKEGRYGAQVLQRGRDFPEKAASDFGFGVALVGLFLMGMWFVRSGVMERSGEHLPMFRRLAGWGLVVGLGLSLASAAIAVSHVPGERHDGWGIASGLHMLANLPACVAYISLVVLALHSRGPLASIRVLAPMGRMALTTYLMQTVICCFVFYGYGLGLWGMGRAAQLVFVLAVFALQLAFSHWWLAHFRYGPMEWLWRGFTYRQVPALRLPPARQRGDDPA